MKKLNFISAALMIAASSQVWATDGDFNKVDYAVQKGWKLEWSDEFNGKDVDESKWDWEQNCWGGGNNELQCYTDRHKNSFLRDGKLVIRAYKETFRGLADVEESGRKEKRTLPYTSARMRTKNKGDWTFGRIDVRAKLPAGQGLWPAIWMLPTDSKYGIWAASGEVDILEMVSQAPEDPNKEVHATLHYGRTWPNNVYSGSTYEFKETDPTKEFHTYSLEWADGEMRWYINDHHWVTQYASGWWTQVPDENGDLYNVEGNAPFNERFHLLINLAVGGTWPGKPDASTKFPAEMEVDFVRVYSCPGAEASLRKCATKNRRAERNFGTQPPQIIKYDPNFINADVVDVFTDGAIPPYALGTYAAGGSVETLLVDAGDRGKVTQLNFKTDQGVVYWQSLKGHDFTPFQFVEFDLRKLADPRKSGDIIIKVDCGYPCSSGEYKLKDAPTKDWKSYRIPLSALIGNAGSSLDLKNVNTPLVVSPGFGNQNGVVLQVDNIRMVR